MAEPWSRVISPLFFLCTLVSLVATLPSLGPLADKKGAATGKNVVPRNRYNSPSSSIISSANSGYHISDTCVDLDYTFFGSPIAAGLVYQTIEFAIDRISANLSLRPTESIHHGSLHHRRKNLEINVYEYAGKQVTWTMLYQLLLGVQHFTRNHRNSRVLEFEIDVLGTGIVGFGSLWYTDSHISDLKVRAIVKPPVQLPNATTLMTSSYPLPLPLFEEDEIVFSFHSFGRTIPERVLTRAFRSLRHVIGNNVRRHPNVDIEHGRFEYTPDRTRIEVVVEADVGKELTWLLLDRIVTRLAANRWSQHVLREFDFDFELYPFEESYGHGTVRYLAAASD